MKITAGSMFLAVLLVLGCSSSDGDKESSKDLLSDGVADVLVDTTLDGTEVPDGEDGASEVAEDAGTDSLETDVDVVEDAADVVVPLEIPHAMCGMPDYELLPADELGELVDWAPIPFWNLGSEDLDSLLIAAGYDTMTPVPYGVKFYKYRYTTQDRGQKVEATAMLGIPIGDVPEGGFVTALNTHGTTGLSDPCAPSYPGNELEGGAVPALLCSLGFVIVAPDYIGMNGMGDPATVRHAYLVGEQAAIGSWDAVRASKLLLAEIEDAPPLDGRVVPWGGSQGGHAALFAELYAPYYAPEFEVPAVVAMIPPLNLLPLFQESVTDIKSGTGLLGFSLAAMWQWYGEQGSLTEVFTDEEPLFFASEGIELIYPKEECKIEVDVDVSQATIDMLFTQNFIEKGGAGDWDALEPWGCFYKENSLPLTSVSPLRMTPTLVIFGEEDDLVYTPPMRQEFVNLCNMGYQMDYMECAAAGHTDAALWSLPNQLEWLQARLAGEPIPESELCVLQEPFCCPGSPEGKCD